MGGPRPIRAEITFPNKEEYNQAHATSARLGLSFSEYTRQLLHSATLEPRLYRIQYRDHLALQNISNPEKYSPPLRECTGWIVQQDEEKLVVVCDRSVSPQPHEKEPAGSNALVIYRRAIEALWPLGSLKNGVDQ